MSNKSLSDVSYQWDCYEEDGVTVSVEPSSGQLGKIKRLHAQCASLQLAITTHYQLERILNYVHVQSDKSIFS